MPWCTTRCFALPVGRRGSTVRKMATTARELRPGDVVTFTIGLMHMRAKVIEDRGHLGIGGRQIVRVELLDDPYDDPPSRFEVAATDVEVELPAAK